MEDSPSRGGSADFELEINPEPRLISAARMFAASVARHYGCDEDTIQDIKIAVSEACSSSVRARESATSRDPIQVKISYDPSALRYQVRDVGAPPEPLPSADALPVDDPSELLQGGAGLVLIHALFPQAEVEAADPGGMVIRFAVLLNGAASG